MLLLALCVAVLSLTAVGFFTSRIAQGVRAQAAEVLAADLRLESPHPIPERYFAESRRLGLASAELLTFPTAIFNGDVSQLVALNAATPGYPLRGHVKISDRRSASRGTPIGFRPAARPGWMRASSRTSIFEPGASVRIGDASFRVAAILDYRPDQGTGFVNLAPAVLINFADVAADRPHPARQPRDLCGAVRRDPRPRWRRCGTI